MGRQRLLSLAEHTDRIAPFDAVGVAFAAPVRMALQQIERGVFGQCGKTVGIIAPAIDRIAVLVAARRGEKKDQAAGFQRPRHFQPGEPKEFDVLEGLPGDKDIEAGGLERQAVGRLQHAIDVRPGGQIDADITPALPCKKRSVATVDVVAAEVGNHEARDRRQVFPDQVLHVFKRTGVHGGSTLVFGFLRQLFFLFVCQQHFADLA